MKQIKSTKMLLASIVLGVTACLLASWSSIGSPNDDVHTTGLGNNDQKTPDVSAILYSGNTRYAVTWQDKRNAGTNYDIYIQTLDHGGSKQLSTTGLLLCNASNIQQNPRIVSDNVQYFYVAWEDQRTGAGNNDIYIQCIDGQSGNVEWTSNGLAVATICGSQTSIELAYLSGSDEVVVTWVDERSGDKDVYAQKISGGPTASGGGVIQWRSQGVPVAFTNGDQLHQKVVDDGTSGGCVLAWENQATSDVYVEQLDNTGAAQWGNGTTGIAPCTTSCVKTNPELVYSGSDFFLAWVDQRTGSDAYFLQFDNTGAPVNSTDPGVRANSGSVSNIRSVKMIRDRNSGMYIAWDQYSMATNYDIYVQRFDNTAANVWTSGGIQASASSVEERLPQMACCSSQLVVTYEYFNGATDLDIYYQKMAASNGALSTGGALANHSAPAAKNQWNHKLTIMDDQAFAAWDDWRGTGSGFGIDVFCSPITMSCSVSSTSIIAPNTTGVKKMLGGESKFRVYPNPGTKEITIDHPIITTVNNLQVFSLDGRMVLQVENFKVGSALDVSSLSPGEYIIKFPGGESTSIRILKQ